MSERSVILLDDVPRLDRFFPSCFWGLVELSAKHRFGVKDIKKAWISHTFVYRPPEGGPQIQNNGNLNLALFNSDRVRQRVAERARLYYGVEVVNQSYDDFSSLLSDIRSHLAAGDLPISAFNMGYLRGRREYLTVFRPHRIGLVGLDSTQRVLLAADQMKGLVQITVDDYAACFEHALRSGNDFTLSVCRRVTPNERPILKDELRSDLRECLDNLCSADENCGLRGLRRAIVDIEIAAYTQNKPFAVPGMWVFSHDRKCLAASMQHWKAASLIEGELATALEATLQSLFQQWFEADMQVEASMLQGDCSGPRKLVDILVKLPDVEERAAHLLEHVHAAL